MTNSPSSGWFRDYLCVKGLEKESRLEKICTDLKDSFGVIQVKLDKLQNFLDDKIIQLQTTSISTGAPAVPRKSNKGDGDTIQYGSQQVLHLDIGCKTSDEIEMTNLTVRCNHCNHHVQKPTPCVSYPSINEDPSEVIASFLKELSSIKVSVMNFIDEMEVRIPLVCNEITDFLQGHTSKTNTNLEDEAAQVKQCNGNDFTKPSGQTASPKGNICSGDKVSVRLYIPTNVNLGEDIVEKLRQLLKTVMFNKYRVKLETETCQKPIDSNSTIPLIVLCIKVSRIEVNFLEALSEVPVNKNVVVVIFHHQDSSNTNVLSSRSKLSIPQCDEINGVLDMVFHSKNGIHTCEVNTQAVNRIAEFLSGYRRK